MDTEGIYLWGHPIGNYRNNNRNYRCCYAIATKTRQSSWPVASISSTVNVPKRIVRKHKWPKTHGLSNVIPRNVYMFGATENPETRRRRLTFAVVRRVGRRGLREKIDFEPKKRRKRRNDALNDIAYYVYTV